MNKKHCIFFTVLKWSAVGWEIISLKSHKNEEEVGIRRKAGQKKKDKNNWWAEKKLSRRGGQTRE